MKIWNEYKPFIKVPQDVLNIKKVTDKSFKQGTQISQEVEKAYKQIFNEWYGDE